MAGNEKLNPNGLGDGETTGFPNAEGTAPNPPGSASAKKRADLVTLFRLLMREPPTDHDFRTCPICKRYGIKEI